MVIAVIALLMAALLPALGAARRHARGVVCQSNLRQWGATLALYAETNQGRFPTDLGGSGGIWFLRGVFLSKDDPNADAGSLHHFGTKGIACCPMAVKPGRGGFGGTANFGSAQGHVQGTPGSTFEAWEITTPAPAFRGSYGCNSWLFSGYSERPRRVQGRLIELDVLTLQGRSNIPTMLDSTYLFDAPRDFQPPPPRDNSSLFCINRHNGHVNGLFLDWSARKIGLKELWTLKWHAEYDTAGRWTKGGGVKPEDWPKWMRKFRDY